MTQTRKISRRQLQAVVSQYEVALPGWQAVHDGQALARDEFPIRQQIGFEALPSGAYRPAHGIQALPVPTSRMLFRYLEIPGREMQYSRHDGHWPEMLSRMEGQFQPSIDKPLDLVDVLGQCERQAEQTVNDYAILSVLCAWLGRRDQAIGLCRSMQSFPAGAHAPITTWEQQMKRFGRDLVSAIEAGSERDFLRELAKNAAKDI